MLQNTQISDAHMGLLILIWLFPIYNLSLRLSREEALTPEQDFGDDTGLLKVLEQQRMATIKAQQEQANKPVKLSTLQCIICMETMKDLTATHCGTSFLFTIYRTYTNSALFKVTSSATHASWKPS